MTKYTQPKIEATPIIDNLTSTDTDKVISANQGKVLDDKISEVTTSLSTSIVDTLNGNEVDRRPTVHTVKDALDARADLTNNKIPLSQLPESLINNNDDGIDRLVAGDGVVVTTKNNKVYVSRAPTKESISNTLSKIKKTKLASALKYKDICYCDNLKLFVAIASNSNKVVTSTDCKVWTEVSLPTVMDYTSIAYSNKLHKICIVGKSTNRFVMSDDGVTFYNGINTASDIIENYVDIVAADNIGMLVAITDKGKMVTTTDGITWTQSSLPTIITGTDYNAITYSPIHNKLVAVGNIGIIVESNTITNATDPITFINKSIPNNTMNLSDVCYSKDLDMYCASTYNNMSRVAISKAPNFEWVIANMSNAISGSNWVKIQYIPFYKIFFMISSTENRAAISYNGDFWEAIDLPNIGNDAKYTSIASSTTINGTCLTVHNSDKFAVVNIDPPFVWDTVRWREYQIPQKLYWFNVCWSPDLKLFCAIGYNHNVAITSPDGITWTPRPMLSTVSQWRALCWSSELHMFCAVSSNKNRIATSPDGITWTERTSPILELMGICWSKELGIFCAVAGGNRNHAVISSDGITWTQVYLPYNNEWDKVCWSPELGKFFALPVLKTNTIAISSDGINWASVSLPIDSIWNGLCWSSELHTLCAVNSNAKSISTTDGKIWRIGSTIQSIGNIVCYAPKLHAFYGIASSIPVFSFDGVTWQIESTNVLQSSRVWRNICWAEELGIFCNISSNNDGKVAIGTPE